MLNHAMQELLFWAPMEVLLCHWPVKLDVLSRRVSPFYINWLFPSHPGMKGSVFSLQVNYTIFKWHHTAKQGIWIRGRNGSCDDMSSACAPCTLASTCKISSRQVWPNNYYRLLPNVEPSTGTSEGTPSHERQKLSPPWTPMRFSTKVHLALRPPITRCMHLSRLAGSCQLAL